MAAIAASAAALSEREVAEILGWDSNFEPLTNPVVRVYTSRLRKRLEDYYRSEGREDEVRLALPAGTYSLAIVRVELTPRQREAMFPLADLTGPVKAAIMLRRLNEELIPVIAKCESDARRGFCVVPLSSFDLSVEGTLDRVGEKTRLSLKLIAGSGCVLGLLTGDVSGNPGVETKAVV